MYYVSLENLWDKCEMRGSLFLLPLPFHVFKFILLIFLSDSADTEMLDENLMDREESEKEVASVSQGSEDTKGSPNNAKESDEVKADADGDLSEDVDSISGNAQKGDEEENSHLEEKAGDELSEDSGDPASKATESDAKEDQESDHVESEYPILKQKGSLTSDVVDSGISDDEPLVILHLAMCSAKFSVCLIFLFDLICFFFFLKKCRVIGSVKLENQVRRSCSKELDHNSSLPL